MNEAYDRQGYPNISVNASEAAKRKKLPTAAKKATAKPAPSLTAQLKAAKAEAKTLKLALAAAEAQLQPRTLLETLQVIPSGTYDAMTEALLGRLRMRLAGQTHSELYTPVSTERVISYDPTSKQ